MAITGADPATAQHLAGYIEAGGDNRYWSCSGRLAGGPARSAPPVARELPLTKIQTLVSAPCAGGTVRARKVARVLEGLVTELR